jgi:nicotinamide riboside transporter PnuC
MESIEPFILVLQFSAKVWITVLALEMLLEIPLLFGFLTNLKDEDSFEIARKWIPGSFFVCSTLAMIWFLFTLRAEWLLFVALFLYIIIATVSLYYLIRILRMVLNDK